MIRRLGSVLLVLVLIGFAPGAGADVEAHSLCGTRILTPSEAAPMVKIQAAPTDLPAALDWRDSGVITPPKNQETCGGCWAFAAIACMEAMCILRGAEADLDLSEQYVISCDREPWLIGTQQVTNDGCCGGTVAVFEFLEQRGSVLEGDFLFANGDHDGPGDCLPGSQWNVVSCPSPGPPQSGWHVSGWSLLSPYIATESELKSALQNGPVWCAYYVYQDFYPTYWHSGQVDVPYTHTSGGLVGGHAVLVIGYDDDQQAWIVKNSWGSSGPFGDGTFLMSYQSNCSFGINAAVCDVDGATPAATNSWGRIRTAFR